MTKKPHIFDAEETMPGTFDIEVGDKVFKWKGYKFPGIVVAKFRTLTGQLRFVVECTVPDCEGMLHIYSHHDIMKKKE